MTEENTQLINEIKRITAKEALSIQIDHEKKPLLIDSKFGGVPYWDMQREYPKNSSGQPLGLLAQINLDELNREEKNPGGQLPKTGMLQFYVDLLDPDCCFGLYKKGGSRVIYHKHIDETVSEAEILKIGMPLTTDNEDSPVLGVFSLKFERKEMYMGPSDVGFNDIFFRAAQNLGKSFPENKSWWDCSKNHDVFFDNLDLFEHCMLGYPTFTQSDPREDDDSLQEYDTLLFQMDSNYPDTMWGDSGICNFFIRQKDLERENFDDVLFNWDCC